MSQMTETVQEYVDYMADSTSNAMMILAGLFSFVFIALSFVLGKHYCYAAKDEVKTSMHGIEAFVGEEDSSSRKAVDVESREEGSYQGLASSAGRPTTPAVF